MDKCDLLALRRKVRHDSDIPMSAAALFADICDMHANGGCWAKDDHFANQYDVHEKTAARWRRKLQRHGYLRREAEGDRVYLVPNLKMVGGPQNHGVSQECGENEGKQGPQNDGQTTNSSPQNRGTHRDNIPAEACESARARGDGQPPEFATDDDSSRDGDPPEVEVWLDVTGERPNIQTRQMLHDELSSDDAPPWRKNVFRDVLKEAYLNVGRDAHRIRVGYLMTSYRRAVARNESNTSGFDPDSVSADGHLNPRTGEWIEH